MSKELFKQIGLTPNEAMIYDYLIKHGEVKAGQIIENTPLKRGVVYITLEDLVKKGLIIERKKDKIAIFNPNHPEKLREIIENKEKELKQAENLLASSLPQLVSDFNLVSNRPGVKYFEGLDGIKKIINDSLTSKEEICTFADMEAIVTHMEKINQAYVKKRDELGISKRAILLDTKFGRNYLAQYHESTTYIKFIDQAYIPFGTVMQIYDNKISYVTLSEKSKIGVLIEDKNIYQMHKVLFDFIWKHAKAFKELA